MKRLARVSGVLLAGLALASCTFVPTDSQPQAVSAKGVPFNLLSKSPPERPPTKPVYEIANVWLINTNNLLAPRPRQVPATKNADLEALRALFAGPTDFESQLGFTSEAPATWRVSGIGSTGGEVIVRLVGPPNVSKTPISSLESGQIVLTAAGTTDQIVEVLINSQPLILTTPGGAATLQMRPSDYEPLVAP